MPKTEEELRIEAEQKAKQEAEEKAKEEANNEADDDEYDLSDDDFLKTLLDEEEKKEKESEEEAQRRKNKDAEEARKRREAEAKAKQEEEAQKAKQEEEALKAKQEEEAKAKEEEKRKAKEEEEKKQQEEAKAKKQKANVQLGEQLAEFKEKYPDVDLASLDNDPFFMDWVRPQLLGKKSFTQLYESYNEGVSKVTGKKVEEVAKNYQKAKGPGSSKSSGLGNSEVYSEKEMEQLAKKMPTMKPEEYAKIKDKYRKSLAFYEQK